MSVWERLHQPKTKNKKILRTRLQYDINVQQEREKKRQAVVFVSSFHPRGGVFCCSWRDGAVCLFFRGGTGRLFFFSEAGRGGCCFFSEAGRGGCSFFPRRDGVAFFFFSTGRDGAVFFFFFRGPGRDGCFWRWQFFWRDGAKSLHRPAKGGLNRPASRPCKALKILPVTKMRLNVCFNEMTLFGLFAALIKDCSSYGRNGGRSTRGDV